MPERILIVDDEEMIRSTLTQRISREGYLCVTANNGIEALHWFYKENFSLMISDIRMPGMNGIELLKKVKAVQPNMLVVMITAFPEINTVVEAMHVGAYDFILKPFDLDLVVFSVKRALEKRRLEEELEAYRQHLERLVEQRTAKLHQTLLTLKKAHLDSVKILAQAIDAKDPYTRGHSDRVRKGSLKIAMKLDFSKKKLENLEFGALLHDIGKIGIRDAILQKQDLLTPEEYQYVRAHALIGVKIAEGVEFFKDKIPIIRHHHEHFDGKGYPDGLIGESIPLEARIISVPDAFDAMTSLRPYRAALALQDVLAELEREKGKQFDPQIVDIFIHEKLY